MARNRRKRLEEIIFDCYRELYKESTPSADFDALLEAAPSDNMGRKVIKYDDYYIPREKFEEIAEKHKKRMKMYRHEEHAYGIAVYLGASPSSKNKKEHDL